MSHLQVSQLISCMERVADAMVAEVELCRAWKERYHVSFCDTRVFGNSGLVLGWILSQIFPLKNGLSANSVHPKQVLCIQLFLLTQERSLVHLSQSALLREQCRGSSINSREFGLKQCVRRLEIPDVLNCLYKNRRIF